MYSQQVSRVPLAPSVPSGEFIGGVDARLLCVPLALPVPLSVVRRKHWQSQCHTYDVAELRENSNPNLIVDDCDLRDRIGL